MIVPDCGEGYGYRLWTDAGEVRFQRSWRDFVEKFSAFAFEMGSKLVAVGSYKE